MNKVRVSFDLSLRTDESTSRIFGWIVDAINMSLERGETMTNLVVEQSEDDETIAAIDGEQDCC